MIEIRSRIGGGGAGQRCPLCQDDLSSAAPRDVYTCRGCGTSFHRACTRELGGCTTLGCQRQGRGQSIVGREGVTPPAIDRGGAWESVAAMGERLPDGRIKLEFDSFMESVWSVIAFLAGMASIGGVVALVQDGPAAFLVVSLIVLGAAILLRMNTDDYYVIDPEAFELLFRRRFFSLESLKRVASFDEIEAVTMSGRKESTKQRSWWEYSVVLVLSNARQVRVNDWSEHGYTQYHHLMEALGGALEARVYPAPLEHTLKVRRNKYTGDLEVTHERHSNRLVYVILAVFLCFLFLPMLLVLLRSLLR